MVVRLTKRAQNQLVKKIYKDIKDVNNIIQFPFPSGHNGRLYLLSPSRSLAWSCDLF